MYTKTFRFATVAMLLGTSLFATSCDNDEKEKTIDVVEKPKLEDVGFSIKPMTQNEWKTTDDSVLPTRAIGWSETRPELHFEIGDMLYVQGFQFDDAHNPIATCISNMHMESGDGSTLYATFSGDVFAPEGTTLDDFDDVTYYLIGRYDKRAKLTHDETYGAQFIELPLGENHIVSSFSRAIMYYSEIGGFSNRFLNDVILQQSNAYFVFYVYVPNQEVNFDRVADIKATFTRPDGTTHEVTVDQEEVELNHFYFNEFGELVVVVPCEIEQDTECFTDIKLVMKAQNGKTLVKNFPSTEKSGNIVEHGGIYLHRTQMSSNAVGTDSYVTEDDATDLWKNK